MIDAPIPASPLVLTTLILSSNIFCRSPPNAQNDSPNTLKEHPPSSVQICYNNPEPRLDFLLDTLIDVPIPNSPLVPVTLFTNIITKNILQVLKMFQPYHICEHNDEYLS